jgi:hypothetical protein
MVLRLNLLDQILSKELPNIYSLKSGELVEGMYLTAY